MTRRRLVALLAIPFLLLPLAPGAAAGADSTTGVFTDVQRHVLREYAVDTWRSMAKMTNPVTGLTADNMSAAGVRAGYTSPTNIATYIWSALAARDMGIITPRIAHGRIEKTLDTLARLDRHQASGMYYNWYDPATGARLTTWPVGGTPVYPFLSTVDNGWLAAALIMVQNSVPRLAARARAIFHDMDFGFFYDPLEGQMRGGYWTEVPPNTVYAPTADFRGTCPNSGTGTVVSGWTCHHYGTLNTEPRIASYIAIAYGQVPATHYFKLFRTFPSTCDWNWQEMQPHGVTRTYLGVDVYEGNYRYRNMKIVPSWGGSMFEALMVPLLVPEEKWGPTSWGVNHPLYVRAQMEHGLQEARYGYWGFSPSNDPAGGYREYGVDPIGLNPDGYTSDEQRTTVDYGFDACRPAQPAPTSYGDGVVTPHASFLALEFAPHAAMRNLANLRRDFDAYGADGFYDAINVGTGEVSKYYLALDQGMIMASIGNALTDDRVQHYFSRGTIAAAIKPLLQMETFSAGEIDW